MPLDAPRIDITLRELMPRAPAGVAEKAEPFMEAAMADNDINTPQRMAGFMASISNETGQLKASKEQGYKHSGYEYTQSIFGSARMPPRALWDQWQMLSEEQFDERFFNYVYDDRRVNIGLGNNQDGDGWKFVGRGAGITGRYLYTKLGAKLGLDLVNNPDLLCDFKVYLPAFGKLWKSLGNNERLDQGDVLGAMKVMNSGLKDFSNHLAEYRRILQKLLDAPKPPPATAVQATAQAATGKTGAAVIVAGAASTTITVADVVGKVGEVRTLSDATKGFLGTFLPSPYTEIALGILVVACLGFVLWRYGRKLLRGDAVST